MPGFVADAAPNLTKQALRFAALVGKLRGKTALLSGKNGGNAVCVSVVAAIGILTAAVIAGVAVNQGRFGLKAGTVP